MFSFIKNFQHDEKYLFWFPFEKRTTVCKMSFSLKSKNNEIFRISCSSMSKDHVHAEEIVITTVWEDLLIHLRDHNTDSSVLDFIIALNNSPCSECRELIFGLIYDLQKDTTVRLILFFSNLFKTKKFGETASSIPILFTKWILELVRIGTVVIISPIVVYQMLPDIKYSKQFFTVFTLDHKCLFNFRKLLKEIKSRKSTTNENFNIFLSDSLFETKNLVHDYKFDWYSPKYISIFPKNQCNILENVTIISQKRIKRSHPSIKCNNSLVKRSKSLPKNK